MKKFMILLQAALIINLLMLPVISGQEIKTEKKIKIIIADNSGEKVVIDTLLSGDSDIETIKLDDGKMIYITGEGKNHENAGSKHVTVMVKSDDDESSIDKSRFVVAKDGMVVTVEGEDEEKAKELMKVIEEHLGINKKEEGKQAKTDSKKSRK